MTTQESKDDFLKQIKKAQDAFKKKMELVGDNKVAAITNACLLLERTMKKKMQLTKTAYTYINPVSGRQVTYKYARSLPYNAPASQVGASGMLGSITHSIVAIDNKTVFGYVGSTMKNPPYPAYLENGTSRMAPRPWALPSLDENRSVIKDELEKVFSDKPLRIEVS